MEEKKKNASWRNFSEKTISLIVAAILVIGLIPISALANEGLGDGPEIHSVTFLVDGTVVQTAQVEHGSYLGQDQIPASPYKEEQEFQGWFLNGSAIDISSYVILEDLVFDAAFLDQSEPDDLDASAEEPEAVTDEEDEAPITFLSLSDFEDLPAVIIYLDTGIGSSEPDRVYEVPFGTFLKDVDIDWSSPAAMTPNWSFEGWGPNYENDLDDPVIMDMIYTALWNPVLNAKITNTSEITFYCGDLTFIVKKTGTGNNMRFSITVLENGKTIYSESGIPNQGSGTYPQTFSFKTDDGRYDITFVVQIHGNDITQASATDLNAAMTVTYNRGSHGVLAIDPNRVMVMYTGLKSGDATPAAPEIIPNEGYEFVGWSPTITSTVTKSVTYVAIYAPKQFHVTFDAQGGTTPQPASKPIIYNEPYGALATTHRPGYTFTGWYFEPQGLTQVTPETIVTQQESHTVYAQWEAIDYQVFYDANGGQGAPEDTNTYNVGNTVTIKTEVPTLPGYSFAGWSFGGVSYRAGSFLTMPASDVTLQAVWTANTNTAYTVYHRGIDDVELLVEHLTGTTGTTATASPGTFAGYVFDSTIAGSVLSGTIAGDGSLVLYVYYLPALDTPYTINHLGTDGTELEIEKLTGGTNAVVTAEALSFAGYTYDAGNSGNILSGTIVADGSLQLYVYYTPNTNTRYTVRHVGTDGTELETEDFTGTTNATVSATAKTFAGYTFDSTNPQNVTSGIIAGDGSLVLTLYYIPNNDTAYTVYHFGTDGELLLEQRYSGTTGSTATAYPTSFDGYSFDITNPGNVMSGVIAADGSLKLYVYYTPNTNTPYVIKHLGTDGAELKIENRSGTTGTTASAVAETFAGYSFDSTNPANKLSGIILGDGSLELLLYYTPNADTPYKVEHRGSDGTFLRDEYLSAPTNTVVGAVPAIFAGYSFDSSVDGTIATGTVKGDGTLVLRLYYTPNSDTGYTVHHLGTDGVKLADEPMTGTTGTTATAIPQDFQGYSFDAGNAGNVLEGTIVGDGSLELWVYYTPNTNTPYTVYHYGTDGVELKVEELSGTTNSKATVVPGSFAGYTFNVDFSSNVLTGTIAADGSLVLYAYYTPNADTEYTVHYRGTDGVVLDRKTLTGTTNTTATASIDEFPGYTHDPNYYGNVLEGTIVGDGSLELWVYYVADTNISYTVNHLSTAGGAPLLVEVLAGTTNAQAEAVVKDFAGYTFDAANAGNVLAGKVAADGSLVLNVYYRPNDDTAYTVYHIGTDGAALMTEDLSGVTGATADAVSADFPGYTFDATNPANVPSGTIAGDGSLVLRLFYTPNEDTAYTVYHYSTDGLLLRVQSRHGTTGQPARAYPGTFAGYTFDSGNAANVLTGIIAGDGSLELYIYYKPNANTAYTVKHLGTDNVELEIEHLSGTTDSTAVAAVHSYPGYTFDVENSRNLLSGTIAADGSLELRVIYTPDTNTHYTVYHLGTDGVQLLVENLTGTTNTTARASIGSFTGYTYAEGYSGEKLSGKIAGDGSLELFVYYKPNTNTVYTVYHLGTDGVELGVENLTGTTNAEANAIVGDFAGYTFDTANASNVMTGFIAADGSLRLYVYYKPNADTAYKVHHLGTDGAELALELFSGTTNTPASASPQSFDGYTFDEGNDANLLSGMIAADGSLELFVYYKPNADTRYTVYHVGTDGAELATESLSGITNTSVNATVGSFDGYTFDEGNAGNVLSGTIAADGSLELFVFYMPNADTAYTVFHLGTDNTTLLVQDLSGTTGQEAVAEATSFDGYTYVAGHQGEVLRGTIVGDGSLRLYLYYSPNSDTHYTVYYRGTDGNELAVLDRTGTTGTTAVATINDFAGYTYDPGNVNEVLSGTIAGDGSLVLYVYYTPNTKTPYRIHHIGTDGIELLVQNLTGTTNTTAAAVALSFPGYSFDATNPANVLSGNIAGDGSLDLYIYYTPNADTAYKVFHLGTDDTTLLVESLSGITNTTADAVVQSFAGYSFDETNHDNVLSGNIAGDGSLELYVYYTPNADTAYKVYHLGTDATTLLVESLSGTTNTTAEAVVLSFAGYTFDTLNTANVLSGNIAGNGSLELYVYYTPNTNTLYTVYHLGTDGAELATQQLSGTTNTTATAIPGVFPGYSFDEAFAGNILSGTIAGNGSLELYVYYAPDANTAYTVHHVGTDGAKLATEHLSGTTATEATAQVASFDGYSFDEGNAGNVLSGIIAGYGSLELYVFYRPNDGTAYTVYHLGTDGFELQVQDLSGTTGQPVSASPASFDGYSFDAGNAGNVQSGTIAGDGSLKLYLYYTPNTNTVYRVHHLGTDGVELRSDRLSGTTNTTATATPATFYGYSFDATNSANVMSGIIAGDGSLELWVYYTPNSNTAYTVHHVGTDATVLLVESVSGTTNQQAAAVPRDFAGYSFDSTNGNNVLTGIIAGNGSLELWVYYKPNTDTAYTVYHLSTNGDELRVEHLKGQTNTIVVAAPVHNIPGYTYDIGNINNVLSGVVAGDGSLVLTIYYKPNTNTPYTVRHLGTDGIVLEIAELTGTTDTTATAINKPFAGYSFDESNAGNVLSGNIAGDGSLVLTLYYTPDAYTAYTVYHLGTDGAELKTENLTGTTNTSAHAVIDSFAGYTFDATNAGNVLSGNIAGDGSLKLWLYYTPDDNTAYTVYYVGTDGTALATQILQGTTNTLAYAEVRTFSGYSYDAANAGNVLSGIIAGDGSLELYVYYMPNGDTPYTVYHLGTDDATLLEENLSGITNTQVSATINSFDGYSYDQGNSANVLSGVVAADGSLVLYVYYTPDANTAYTVYHIGTDGAALDTQYLTGITNTRASASVGSFAGYSFDEFNVNNVLTGIIAGDGSLELFVYYSPNADTAYTVHHLGTDGITLKTQHLSGTTATTATAIIDSFAGYSFDADAANVLSGVIAGNGSLELFVYYKPDTNTAYKVHYLGTDAEVLREAQLSGTTNTQATAEILSFAGYSFDETNPANVLSGNIAGDGSLELWVYYTPNSATAYTVNHRGTDGIELATEFLSGTTNTAANAEIGDFAGYTYAPKHQGEKLTGIIAGDGSLELWVFYTPNSDTAYLVHYYGTNGIELLTEELSGTTNTVAEAQIKSFAGYSFDETYAANVLSGVIAGNGSLELWVYYTPNADTNYTVNHLGTNGVELEIEYLMGTTDERAEAVIGSFPGYSFSEGNAGNVLSGTIAGDGSLVLTVYYMPDEDTPYTVYHMGTDGITLATENLSGVTGEQATAEVKSFAGYSYDATNSANILSGEILGNGTLALFVYYTPNADTPYRVEHLGTDGIVLAIEELSGTTNTPATAEAMTFAGYTYDSGNPGNKVSGNIEGDGSLVLTLYYTPNTNTPYRVYHLGTDGVELDFEQLAGITNTTANAVLQNFPGYTFDATNAANVLSGTIAGDGSLVLYIYYTPDADTLYTVYHLGTNGVKLAVQELSGTTNTEATARVGAFPGYTYAATYPGELLRGNIAGDGSLKLYVYYRPNTNTPYKVEYWGTDGIELEIDTLSGTTDTTVQAAQKTFAGYSFDAANANNIISGNIAGDGSLVLRLYYTPNPDTAYTVFYLGTNGKQLAVYNLRGTTNTQISAAIRTFAGYSFDTNNVGNVTSGTIAGDGSLKLYVYYTPNTDTAYTVQHLGTDGVILEIENSSGTTDETAHAIAGSYEGYTFDVTNPGNVLSGTIAGDGTLVLTLYYMPNDDTPYRVFYLGTNGVELLVKGLSGTTNTTATASVESFPGYTYDEENTGNVLSGNIAGNGSLKLYVFYTPNEDTPYKVEHVGTDGIMLGVEDLVGITDTTVRAQNMSFAGYSFDRFNSANITSGNLAGDGSLVLRLYYTPNTNTPYVVHHLGTDGIELQTQNLTGTTNTQALAVIGNFDGYSFAPDYADNVLSGNIAGDGSLELFVYYTPNPDTAYTVFHRGTNGVLLLVESLTGTTNTTAAAVVGEFAGYSFDEANEANVLSGNIAGNGSLVLFVYYTPEPQILSFNGNGATAGTMADEEHDTDSSFALTANAFVREGYTFAGWASGPAGAPIYSDGQLGFIMPPNSLTLYAIWVANPGTPYTVLHINVVNENTLLTQNFAGATDSTAFAYNQNIAGFTYTYDAREVRSDIISADGSLVLRLYYTPVVAPAPPTIPGEPTGDPLVDLIQSIAGGAVPLVNLGGNLVPLTSTYSWSLVNLILTIVGALAAIVFLISYLFRRRQEEDETETAERLARIALAQSEGNLDYDEKPRNFQKRFIGRMLVAALAAVAIFVFILTQDMSLPMALIDKWSATHLLIFAGQVVCWIITSRKKRIKTEDSAADLEEARQALM